MWTQRCFQRVILITRKRFIKMTRKWSKKFEQCQQCGTVRYNHVAKGLCTRCYRLVKKLEQVSQWDLSNPASFKGYKGYIEGWTYYSAEKFERIKSGVARKIRKRLEFLQGREETLKDLYMDSISSFSSHVLLSGVVSRRICSTD